MEEILIRTADVSVRILGLEAREELPWHYHSEVTDYVFALDGEIEIQLRSPVQKIPLTPGKRYEVSTGRVHRVVNLRDKKTKYLLIQGIGRYDFNKVSS